MSNGFRSGTILAITVAACAAWGVAHARGSEVGTHIYSPGPMVAGQSFQLEMAMSPHAMKVIETDMAGHTLSCRMTSVPHHRGMVMLTCMPG